MSHKAPGVFNREKSKISFQRKLTYNPPAHQILVAHHGPQGCKYLTFLVFWDRIKNFPRTLETFNEASPTQYKNPHFTSNRGVQVVTVKSYLQKVKLSSFPFKGCFHFLLSLQPLESCRRHRYIKTPTKLCGGKQECVLQKFIKIYDLRLAASI